MTDRTELRLALMGIGYKQAPGPLDNDGCGAVHTSTADGAYFNVVGEGVQILVVGRMTKTPIEHAEEVSAAASSCLSFTAGYWVKHVEVLGTDYMAPHMAQIVRDRGFFLIILQSRAVEDRPAPPTLAALGDEDFAVKEGLVA